MRATFACDQKESETIFHSMYKVATREEVGYMYSILVCRRSRRPSHLNCGPLCGRIAACAYCCILLLET
jgi:hypothetical protein